MTTVVDVAPVNTTGATSRAVRLSGGWRPSSWLGPAVAGALTFVAVVAHSSGMWADSYFDLYAGRDIWQHGIPHYEVLTSAAAGSAWQDQQWLAHLLFYGTWRLAGYPAVTLLSALLVAGALALLARTLVRAQVPGRTAALWTVVAASGCLSNTVPRAQSFAYPLFILTIAIVFSDSAETRRRPRLLLLLPVLMLWANLHGSVLLGASIVAGYSGARAVAAAMHRDRRALTGYAGMAAGSVASLFVTPYGLSSVHYYTKVFGNSTLTHSITEWRPPSWSDSVSLLYFVVAILVLIVAVVTAIAHRHLPATAPTLIVLALFALSTRAVRNEIWFVLAATVWAAVSAKPARRRAGRSGERRHTFRAPALMAVALLVGGGVYSVVVQPLSHFEAGVSRSSLAMADSASLAAGAPILADELQSTALLWDKPDTTGRVAYDIRFEQYPPSELADYINFLRGGSGALSFAARYPVVLLSRSDHTKVAGLLERSPDWRIAGESTQAIVFTHRSAS